MRQGPIHAVRVLAFTVLAFVGWPAATVQAEEMTLDQQIQFVRSLTAAERQATLARAVVLTDEESQQFWPLYRAYRAEVASLDDQTVTLIRDYADNYASLTGDKAKQLTETWLDIEKKRLAAKQKYVKKYEKVLPGLKVARVMQVENRLDLLVQLRLVQNVPLVKPS